MAPLPGHGLPRTHRAAPQVYGAGAAQGLAAAELGAAQAQFVTQHGQQVGLVVAVKLHGLLIDMEHGFWGIAHCNILNFYSLLLKLNTKNAIFFARMQVKMITKMVFASDKKDFQSNPSHLISLIRRLKYLIV